MRKSTPAAIPALLFQSQGTMLAILFFFAAGLSAGVFVELFLGSSEKLQMADYLAQGLLGQELSDASVSQIFFQSAGNNLGLLLLLFAAGISIIGFPAVFLAIAYKGMALGFSSALLIESLSEKGIKLILFSMVPQNLVLLPALLAASVVAANLAFSTLSGRGKGIKKSLEQYAGPYLSAFLLLTAAVLLGCLIEGFISPALLRLAG